MTECRHPHLPLVSALDLTPVEHLLLDILRMLCTGLEHDRLAYWMNAFEAAEERFGAIDGPLIVSAAISLLRALRAERACGFGYMSNECPHISEDEQDVMKLIRAACCTQHSETHLVDAAAQIATVETPSRLIAAARAIGALCIRHESPQDFGRSTQQQHPAHLN